MALLSFGEQLKMRNMINLNSFVSGLL